MRARMFANNILVIYIDKDNYAWEIECVKLVCCIKIFFSRLKRWLCFEILDVYLKRFRGKRERQRGGKNLNSFCLWNWKFLLNVHMGVWVGGCVCVCERERERERERYDRRKCENCKNVRKRMCTLLYLRRKTCVYCVYGKELTFLCVLKKYSSSSLVCICPSVVSLNLGKCCSGHLGLFHQFIFASVPVFLSSLLSSFPLSSSSVWPDWAIFGISWQQILLQE